MATMAIPIAGKLGQYTHFDEQNEPGLYLVKPTQPDLAYTCDIFLLHGLNGAATRTWQTSQGFNPGHIWFRDYLPSLVKDDVLETNARIWTFGYNANVFISAAPSLDMSDFVRSVLERVRQVRSGHENHRIIWITHSMGGVIAKMALIEAKLDTRYTSIFDATSGIIFLGTPHRGSSAASLGSIAARVARYSLLINPNMRLLQKLQLYNDFLSEKSHQFSKICSSFRIFSFYETQKTNGIMVVPKQSAVIGLPNEIHMPLDGDHRSIAQSFVSPFRDAILELMRLTIPDLGLPGGLAATTDVPEGFVRCAIRSWDGSKQMTALYPQQTTIKALCESAVPKEWYHPNTTTGLQRPTEDEPIPWYTNTLPAITTSGPSTYDVADLRINEHEPIVVFFSKALNNRKLTASLGAFMRDTLSPAHEAPNIPCIHVNDSLAISFHRTVRIPDDGGSYPAPNSLGVLPIVCVTQIGEKLPSDAVEKGGLIVPLFEMEALKINFHVYGPYPRCYTLQDAKYAVRIFTGGVNGLSGEPVKANMATVLKRLNGIKRSQDYLYLRGGDKPAQQWLDGVSVAPNIVRQFVAVPHLSSSSIEQQVMGSGAVGGIQLEIIPQHLQRRFTIMLWDHYSPSLPYNERRKAEYPHPWSLESPSDFRIPLNTRIHAWERDGKSRERTLLDELDWLKPAAKIRRTVELQLWPSPSSTDFNVRVKFPDANNNEIILRVFPEKKVCFVRDHAAHAFGLPPAMWHICLPGRDRYGYVMVDQQTTLRSANIGPEHLLVLMPALLGGGGTESEYSPLMDVGASGKIRQHIVPDEEDARSWSTDEACLINIQIMDAKDFASTTGLGPPPSPITFATYLERGIPFFQDRFGALAKLEFGLSQIKSADQILSQVQSVDTRCARSNEKLPGYCDNCTNNWASYRLLPCRHLICANCQEGWAQRHGYRVTVQKKNCQFCSKRIEDMSWLGRERVITGQVNDDRDPFESIVERRQNTSMNGLQAVMDTEPEGCESIGTGSDSEDDYKVPGSFRPAKASDEDSCVTM